MMPIGFSAGLSVVYWILAGASVDLDFVNNRYFGPTSYSVLDYLSISRASIGYAKTYAGTLTQFSSGQLRQTDLGLLIEDARTNIQLYSQDFTQTSQWTLTNLTLTADIAAAPDGTITADKLIPTAVTAGHSTGGNTGSSSGATKWTASGYFKRSGFDFIWFLFNAGAGGSVYQMAIDLIGGTIPSTRTFGTPPTGVTTGVETLANGWFRVFITMDVAATVTLEMGLDVQNSGTFTQTIGNGVDGVLCWGMQIEQGSFPTSYIPTTGTSATRAADNISIIGSAQPVITAAAASIVAQSNYGESTSYAATMVDSNGTNLLGFDATNHGLTSITASLATSNTANRTSRDKLGTAWDGTGRSLVLNGSTVATDATAQVPLPTQNLGSASGTSNFAYAYVERLTLWNSKLANATLQGFTS